jgi:hypothetical protein
MAALLAFLVGTIATIVIGWATVGRSQVLVRDPTFDPVEVGRRYVTILGGLAGFAVTGMIFLVTLGRSLPGADNASYTTVVAMFLVAYIGFLGVSILFANIHGPSADEGFDVSATMFAGGTVMVWFIIGIGWLALIPLFEIVGLHQLAALAGWVLLTSTLASYSLNATQIYRTGLVGARLALLIPVLAGIVVLTYGVMLGVLGLHPVDSTLAITIAGLLIGLPAYAAISILPALARHERLGRIAATAAPFGVFALAEGSAVIIGLLLFTILGSA